jgi:hypothetical protein
MIEYLFKKGGGWVWVVVGGGRIFYLKKEENKGHRLSIDIERGRSTHIYSV